MLTILYHADTTGPVAQRVAKAAERGINVLSDKERSIRKLDTVLRWGSVANVNAAVQINTVEAVAACKDKRQSRRLLGDLAPATWYRPADVKVPCVIRPWKHHAGINFHVCRTQAEVNRAISRHRRWYASELIDKSTEYRVFVLHGRIVAVSQRFPANDREIAWNLARGGRLVNLRREEWDDKVLQAAIDACNRIGLDWGAMDLAVSKQGKTYVFEANTAPGLRNPYTLRCVGKALLWAAENGKPAEVKGRGWKAYIHPTLRERQ
jgi:glutathione synthase/RimK-type ligase-like ATP-grasp enzyme